MTREHPPFRHKRGGIEKHRTVLAIVINVPAHRGDPGTGGGDGIQRDEIVVDQPVVFEQVHRRIADSRQLRKYNQVRSRAFRPLYERYQLRAISRNIGDDGIGLCDRDLHPRSTLP